MRLSDLKINQQSDVRAHPNCGVRGTKQSTCGATVSDDQATPTGLRKARFCFVDTPLHQAQINTFFRPFSIAELRQKLFSTHH